MAGTAIAGKGGQVVAGVTKLNLDKWKVTLHAVDIPTTNFEDESNGETYTSGITGPREADLEFNGFYDTKVGYLPFAAPLLFTPGVTTLVFKLFPKKAAADTAAFVFTNGVRIIQCATDCDVNGRVNFAFNGKSNGIFSIPTTAA